MAFAYFGVAVAVACWWCKHLDGDGTPGAEPDRDNQPRTDPARL